MRIVPAIEAEIRREIRDARAVDPLISLMALEQRLEKKFNRGFSYKYVAKLADKVARQALIEADRTKIEERLAFTRENYRVVRDRLMKIIAWQPSDKGRRPYDEDVINAGKTIVGMDLAILKAEIDNGLYRRPMDAIVKDFQYEPLEPETRMVIIAAWQRGGLLPAAVIEGMVPVQSIAE
ncbi:MAG TPA: hypothetical protein VHY35_06270 [Stellaceae bacterium]|jgi:hypothetical protein|nr:hypothetical protein [Stellaceae bacterium]